MMKTLGQRGEELVCKKYLQEGFQLLEKNYIFPKGKQMGELDLVFSKGKDIVFVEVKTRSNSRFGSPFDSVDTYKQRKLVKTAKLYLNLHKAYLTYNYRIDVAAVDIDPVRDKNSNGVDNPQNSVIILKNAIEDLD